MTRQTRLEAINVLTALSRQERWVGRFNMMLQFRTCQWECWSQTTRHARITTKTPPCNYGGASQNKRLHHFKSNVKTSLLLVTHAITRCKHHKMSPEHACFPRNNNYTSHLKSCKFSRNFCQDGRHFMTLSAQVTQKNNKWR